MSDRQVELAQREERAQLGIVQFAEEMKAIRDLRLYPGAPEVGLRGNNGGGEEEAWSNYCQERWGMTAGHVHGMIQAIDVIQRRFANSDRVGAGRAVPGGMSAAARVATFPWPVQDAILDNSETRTEVSARATAVRKEMRRIERTEHRAANDAEMIEAALAVDPPKKKRKKKLPEHIALIRYLGEAEHFCERAANYAQANDLDDWINDFTVELVGRIEYEVQRVKDTLRPSTTKKDWDEEAAKFLTGGAS